MTDITQAEQTLRELEAKRDALIAKAAHLAKERNEISYRAHVDTKDLKARGRLDEIIKESLKHDHEMASLVAAISEAKLRLAAAQRAAVMADDRTVALELRKLNARRVELADILDDCFTDFKSAAAEMKEIQARAYALGQKSPTHDQERIYGGIAIKSALQGTQWTREVGVDVIPMHQRKTFGSIVRQWVDAQMPEINRRIEPTKTTNKEDA